MRMNENSIKTNLLSTNLKQPSVGSITRIQQRASRAKLTNYTELIKTTAGMQIVFELLTGALGGSS